MRDTKRLLDAEVLAHMQVHVCVFSFCRFAPQELLSFLHRSLIEGRRDQGRREGSVGGAGRGWVREGGGGWWWGGNAGSLLCFILLSKL